MAKPISDDLRERACRALAEGVSGREVARRFAISAASISRWRTRLRQSGNVSAARMGGDRRSQHIEAHAELLLARMHAQPDTTLVEYRALLAEAGFGFGLSSVWRFFVRRRITLKKSRRTRPNKSDPMSPKRAQSGALNSVISIRPS